MHVSRIDTAEIALGIDIGMQQGIIAAGQAHHGFIDSLVAMGIELHGLTDNIGRFRPVT